MLKTSASYPRLFPRPEQTIAGIGRMLRKREVSCADILDACFEQVDRWESKVHAWVVLDREGAKAQARELDGELRKGKDRGPLHGIPVGIKDIIDVKGLPTACGAKRWTDRIADKDADLVLRLREAGAVIQGKTVTTPYAWIDPPATRNPWDLERTPGGSSSGSAAAVACGMCYGAIGTQTGGSITRPASFCGVASMKPGHGQVSLLGVSPLASSLDHAGPLARAVEDLGILRKVVAQFVLGDEESRKGPFSTDGPPRIGRPRGFFDRRADPAARAAIDDAVSIFAGRGAEIIDLDDPIDFELVLRDHRCVMSAEAASVHSEWLESNSSDYPPRIRELVSEGRSIMARDYIRARERMFPSAFQFLSRMFEARLCCAITPATVGTAPDRTTTGDPAFNSPWSYTRLPTVSFPVALAEDGMPVALQLVGHLHQEHDLVKVARWCEQAIQTWQQ